MTHDQNFKNLILDYPRQALAFFAAAEVAGLGSEVRIVPLRQEQLKERLGERFRELDVPLLLEWPDGRRAALLFVIEEESDPRRFSVHRLIHYCVDLSELFGTDRVVPVVIFLHGGPAQRGLKLGGDRQTYLSFSFLCCELAGLAAAQYRDSDNIVVRLLLPTMKHEPAERVAVYAQALRGLTALEPDPEKQRKYLDFIDIYAGLDDTERARFQREYPSEAATMTRFEERFRQEGLQQGMQQGMQEGMQQGEAALLLRLLERRFGGVNMETRQRIEQADSETLLAWSDRLLSAGSLDEVVH